MKEDCIFCKIAAGEIPSKTIYEDEEFRVILDISPAVKGHALIIPKDHYANLFELPEALAVKVMILARKLAAHMKEVLQCDGFNLVQNNGKAGKIALTPNVEQSGMLGSAFEQNAGSIPALAMLLGST